MNAADPPVADSESIFPSGIAGVGFRQKVGNRESIEEGFQRARKVAAFLLDIAEAGECPTFVKRLIAGPRKFGYALKPLLRVGKIAVIDENSARPIQTRDIVRIKRDSLLISLQRALRIGKASDRAEMAVGGGSFALVRLAVFFSTASASNNGMASATLPAARSASVSAARGCASACFSV